MRLSALLVAAVALSPAWAVPASAVAQGYDPLKPPKPQSAPGTEVPTNPEFEDLPDAPGVEETFYLCTGCHSAALIKQQRISDARWDYLWNWMIEQQGMPEVDEETKAIVLAYLKLHFSSER